MPIKFPTVHIAESVRNQILDVWDEIQGDPPPVPEPAAPVVPEVPGATAQQSTQLDMAGQAPPPELSPPDAELGDLGGAVARGEDLLAGT